MVSIGRLVRPLALLALVGVAACESDRPFTGRFRDLERDCRGWGDMDQFPMGSVRACDELVERSLAIGVTGEAIADIYIERAEAFEDLDRPEDALASVDLALEAAPDYAAAYYRRMRILRDADRYEEALAAINDAVAADPEDTRLLYWRARVHSEMDNPESALEDFNAYIEANPDDDTALRRRASTYQDLDDIEGAVADLTEAIAIDPTREDQLFQRAEYYEDLEEWDLALADYDRLIAIDPEEEYYYYQKGRLLHYLDRYDEAIVAFREAIAATPEYEWPHRWLVRTYLEIDDIRRAAHASRAALPLLDDADRVQVIETYLRAFSLSGDIEDGIRAYERGAEIGGPSFIEKVQEELAEDDYYDGPFTGEDSEETREALRACLRSDECILGL
ncbi:MAG: tetratricopeptide repeat protein [Azospirillaceae bacterium]